MADFMQSVPKDGNWRLKEPYDKRAAQLVYVDDDGKEILVPSVWYNQPVTARIEAMTFYAERAENSAAIWRAARDSWAPAMAEGLEQQAKRLRALANEMKSTGAVIA